MTADDALNYLRSFSESAPRLNERANILQAAETLAQVRGAAETAFCVLDASEYPVAVAKLSRALYGDAPDSSVCSKIA